MITLADYTAPDLIVAPLQNRTPPGVVGELCLALEKGGRVGDRLSFYDAVLNRELLSPTGTPPGWALPHGRLVGSGRLSFALGFSLAPIEWFSVNAHPVRMVFLFAVPESEGAAYLSLISGLAGLSRDPVRVQSLLRSPDRESLFEALGQVPVPQARPAPASATAPPGRAWSIHLCL